MVPVLFKATSTTGHRADHAVLRILIPIHAMLAAPSCYSFVTFVRPEPARLLVAVECEVAQSSEHGVQRILYMCDPYLEPRTQCLKLGVQTQQAFAHKLPLPVARARLLPMIKLDGVKTQGWSLASRPREGGVVLNAQVALEPDDLWRFIPCCTHTSQERRAPLIG